LDQQSVMTQKATCCGHKNCCLLFSCSLLMCFCSHSLLNGRRWVRGGGEWKGDFEGQRRRG